MGIRQLPSGRHQARVMIEGRNYTETFDTRAQAAEWELVTRAKGITGSLPGHVTVAEYACRWMAGYETAPVNTRTFHERNLRQVLVELGEYQVAKVVPTDITRFLNRIIDAKGAAEADRVYRTTSALFGAAYADGLCPNGSPVRSKRHRPRRQASPHVVLERPQARAMLLQLGGWQRDTALLQLSLGARFGEIAGLTPHDVNLATGRIMIRRRFSYSAGTVRATKNHRHRELDIPTSTRPTLERLIREACDPPPVPDLMDRELDAEQFRRQWLIQTRTGRPAANSAFNKDLKVACRAAHVPELSSHGLRHTYVSWMIDEGYTAEQIAFWIGDTPQTVMQVYAHMLEASSAPAAAAIDSALSGL